MFPQSGGIIPERQPDAPMLAHHKVSANPGRNHALKRSCHEPSRIDDITLSRAQYLSHRDSHPSWRASCRIELRHAPETVAEKRRHAHNNTCILATTAISVDLPINPKPAGIADTSFEDAGIVLEYVCCMRARCPTLLNVRFATVLTDAGPALAQTLAAFRFEQQTL